MWTRAPRSAGWQRGRFQSLSRDSVHVDAAEQAVLGALLIGFNPSVGIPSMWTIANPFLRGFCFSFNPSVGIPSMWTKFQLATATNVTLFQSLSRDSVHVDWMSTLMTGRISTCFNPSVGIPSMWTRGILRRAEKRGRFQSLSRDSVHVDSGVAALAWSEAQFQSLSRDSVHVDRSGHRRASGGRSFQSLSRDSVHVDG